MFSRKWAQEDRFWCILTWVLAWRCKLGFPDFARPLERVNWRSSGESEHPVSLHCFTVRSSGGLGARAESCLTLERESSGDFTHPVLLQNARVGKFTLERVPLLHDRSSGETWARAGLCFSENAFKRTSLHPHPILGILRPSLRHLNEYIDVEHTDAN